MMLKKLNIAIIGGSVAGHLNALSLLRLGANVTVFERSSKTSFKDRGVGIGVPTAVVDSVKALGFFDDSVRHDHCSSFSRIVPSLDHPVDGRVVWQQPVQFELMSWSEIFRQFFGQIAEDIIHYDSKVLEVGMHGDRAFIRLEGETAPKEFDLVIGADGYLSTARKFVSPTSVPVHAGYVLWRGSMPEEDLVALNINAPCLEQFSFVFLPDCGGHVLFYYVRKSTGNRVLTWGQYIPVTPADLTRVMTDSTGVERANSIPPGLVQPLLENEWKARALAHMPTHYSAVIAATENTFIQGIFDVELPSLVRDRVILTGDAGSVARPHTVAGFSKAFENANALAASLQNSPTIDAAIEEYNASELSAMQRTVVLGEQLGRGTVLEVPRDMASWDEERLKQWMGSLADVRAGSQDK